LIGLELITAYIDLSAANNLQSAKKRKTFIQQDIGLEDDTPVHSETKTHLKWVKYYNNQGLEFHVMH